MKYDVDLDYDDKKEFHKPVRKETECGKIEIKAENVYITIVCDKEKKEC